MSDASLDLPPGSVAAIELGLAHEVRTVGRVSSAAEAAEAVGVPADALVKTLVVRRGDDDFLFVLVPGPRSISWPELRAHLGVSRLSMPDPDVARDVTGYERGTITPLGSQRAWPVIADASLAGHAEVALGSGRHGSFVVLPPGPLFTALDVEVVDVASG